MIQLCNEIAKPFFRLKIMHVNMIGGFGPNGAIIHYTTSEDTNVVIDTSSLLLVDSGGQYLGNFTYIHS